MKNLAVAYAVNRRNKMARGGCAYAKGGEAMSGRDINHPKMLEDAIQNPDNDATHFVGKMDERMRYVGDQSPDGFVEDKPWADREGMEPIKEALGGMIEEDLDLDSDLDDSFTSQVLNEEDNPTSMSEDESDEMGKPKKSRLLGRILGALKQAHLPDRGNH